MLHSFHQFFIDVLVVKLSENFVAKTLHSFNSKFFLQEEGGKGQRQASEPSTEAMDYGAVSVIKSRLRTWKRSDGIFFHLIFLDTFPWRYFRAVTVFFKRTKKCCHLQQTFVEIKFERIFVFHHDGIFGKRDGISFFKDCKNQAYLAGKKYCQNQGIWKYFWNTVGCGDGISKISLGKLFLLCFFTIGTKNTVGDGISLAQWRQKIAVVKI